ncbi:tape measure protein [Vibrio parahaemolyticus]|uniref:tape measure protein n=1 Tax=Vibrio parahaemolyticus TaxID=670 RepID=UPI002B20C2B0|nr:tape measure protein [Vibrio parahaemolyticus]MEA5313389.1 tape measure protein [Vibrio parahaemolyticus]
MAKKLETDIVLNLKGDLQRKARQYGNSMASFAHRSETAMLMLNRSISAASKGIDSFGNRTLFGAGVAAIAFERTFVRTAASFERLRASMESMMGSESGAQEALNWIEKFTQETPYSVEEVTKSFIRLKTFGLDPMDGSLQSIADQSAKVGGNAEMVEGVATALGQAWTKGKLQAEELNQMLERGVPVYEYLQKASKDLGHNFGKGFSKAQLNKMAESGKLTRDTIRDLIRVMGEESEGAALKQMETWNGMISNIGDHWTLFQRDIMDSGAFKILKDELGEFLDMLDEMKSTGQYDKFVEDVGGNLVDSFKVAAQAITALKDAGEGLLPMLKAVGIGAQKISDAVGGYGNLAKILASVYAVNKAISIGAPLIKGGAAASRWILDKSSGKTKGHGVLADGFSSLGASRVFVVNWPNGGYGSPMLPDLTPDSDKMKKSSLVSKALDATGKAFVVGYLMEDIFGDTDFAKQMKQTTLADVFPSVFGANEDRAESTGDRINRLLAQQQLPAYLTGQYKPLDSQSNYPVGGDLRVKVDVSDDRVKTSIETSSPSIKIDPDSGLN